VILNFTAPGGVKSIEMFTYNREGKSKSKFFGFPPCYLRIGVLSLCEKCRKTLSPYFFTTVLGSGLEINKLLGGEPNEAVFSVISLFKRWIIEFLKRQIEYIYEIHGKDRAVGISCKFLKDAFALYGLKSEVVLSTLNELVREKYLDKTEENTEILFWGPSKVEKVAITISSPRLICTGEAVKLTLRSTHGGFIKINAFKDKKEIFEKDVTIAAREGKDVKVTFPASGHYKAIARYFRVEKEDRNGKSHLVLNSTEATRELAIEVRPPRPSLTIKTPYVDLSNPGNLRFVTDPDATTENITLKIDGENVRSELVKGSNGKFEVMLRKYIGSVPRVHIFSVEKSVAGVPSCPSTSSVFRSTREIRSRQLCRLCIQRMR